MDEIIGTFVSETEESGLSNVTKNLFQVEKKEG